MVWALETKKEFSNCLGQQQQQQQQIVTVFLSLNLVNKKKFNNENINNQKNCCLQETDKEKNFF